MARDPLPLKTARRAGQVAGAGLILAIMLLVARGIRQDDPAPDLTPGEIILDALDRSDRACVTRDDVVTIVDSNLLRRSDTAPLDCTDAPPGTDWLAVTAEDRIRYYAFGPDGCRIPVTVAACP